MIWTNKYNIHPVIAAAIMKNDYDYIPGALSVSTMCYKTPYQAWLIKNNPELETEDVSDGLWRMLGSGVHKMIEGSDNHFVHELRVTTGYLLRETNEMRMITGKLDVYDIDDRAILDIKVTSKYSTRFGNAKFEWIAQLNCLKYLLTSKGFDVGKLGILVINRDSMKSDIYKSDFENIPFLYMPIEVWPHEQTRAYIEAAIKRFDLEIPNMCTPEERWCKSDLWTIMKHDGTGKSLANCETKEIAEERYSKISMKVRANYSIQLRKGDSDTRCKEYCSIKKACPHWRTNHGN